MRAFLASFLVALGFMATPAFAQQSRSVDLELVLAIDTSTSVDAQEFDLQWRGLANAFLHPDVVGAIEAIGDAGIAVSMVQWAGPGQHQISVEWSFINDARSAAQFAAKISAAPRLMRGFTDIAGAISYSVGAIEGNAYDGFRRVIDVSGDGSSSGLDNPGLDRQRDYAISRGIIINGLVIYNEEYDLGELAHISVREHYENHVIGGAASFLMIANDFEDFARAIREKLIQEITGPPIAGLRRNGSRDFAAVE
ncbi:MAG: DUF1194 domain-containing protein [Rhizobiales bacterium]|nr:DUF1194 domain-containing protein [Hyphomicrobiales bacterium]